MLLLLSVDQNEEMVNSKRVEKTCLVLYMAIKYDMYELDVKGISRQLKRHGAFASYFIYIYVGEWCGELREAGWKHEGRVKSQRLL